MFEYDRLAPLEAVVREVETQDSSTLFDLSYRVDGDSDRSHGWLIVPPRSQPIPFVVLLHGGGQDRGACLAEAWLLAGRGVGSLLVDLPQARSFPNFSNPAEEQSTFTQTVISVARGVDYLALRENFDLDQEFARYATGLNLLKVYDSATHLQMFFHPGARQDRISWLDAQLTMSNA